MEAKKEIVHTAKAPAGKLNDAPIHGGTAFQCLPTDCLQPLALIAKP